MTDATRYPLSWPLGWKRTPAELLRLLSSLKQSGGSAAQGNTSAAGAERLYGKQTLAELKGCVERRDMLTWEEMGELIAEIERLRRTPPSTAGWLPISTAPAPTRIIAHKGHAELEEHERSHSAAQVEPWRCPMHRVGFCGVRILKTDPVLDPPLRACDVDGCPHQVVAHAAFSPSAAQVPPPAAYCMDCGLSYADDGFCDLAIPNEAWRRIAPDDGLLCAVCMSRRARKAGLGSVVATFRSGPFAPQGVIDAAISNLDYWSQHKHGSDELQRDLKHAAGVLRNLAAPPAPSQEGAAEGEGDPSEADLIDDEIQEFAQRCRS